MLNLFCLSHVATANFLVLCLRVTQFMHRMTIPVILHCNKQWIFIKYYRMVNICKEILYAPETIWGRCFSFNFKYIFDQRMKYKIEIIRLMITSIYTYYTLTYALL
jgi:hypothetical protein